MVETIVNKKRIARNTIYLYIRMLLVMGVMLYTQRVVLDKLGASDYGIYHAVGGVVAMLGFLNSTLSTGTSRFLTYKDSNDISSIGIISVNPKFQGLGIGSKLMSHYQSLLKPNIKLQTVVTQGCNIKARTLYEKNGYGILDRTYTYHLWV